MKRYRPYLALALAAVAYVDMSASVFASLMGLRELAIELVCSGLLLVVAAFVYGTGEADGN